MGIFRKKDRAKPAAEPTERGVEIIKRSMDMGSIDRLTADWFGTSLTYNQMLFSQMETIRKRARDLALNSPWARRFLAMARTNVVGSAGFSFSARGMLSAEQLDERGNREIEALWKEWKKPLNCTMCGRMSFDDVANQNMNSLFMDGEFVIREIFGAPNRFGYALSLLPIDQLDHTLNRPMRRDASGRVIENAIKLGVEVDEWGRPLNYYFTDGDDSPVGSGYGLSGRKHLVYPASEIIHVFPVEQVGQARGFSFMAPAGTRTKMLNAYEEAAVIHKRIAASKMAMLVPDSENPPPKSYEGDGTNDDGSISMSIEPGIFEKLPLGYKLDKFDVEDVSDGFSDFSKQILRSLASAWNVNFNTLANDYSDVNYSSIRHGALEDRDAWKCIQRFYIEQVLDRIYANWLKWTLTMGITFINPANYQRFMRVQFQGRRWSWIDPLKEEAANEKALKNRTTSRHEICRQQGLDYDDIQAELKKEADDAVGTETGEQA